MVKRYPAKLNPSKFIGRRLNARHPAPIGTTALANRPVTIACVHTIRSTRLLIDAYVIGIIDILQMVFNSKRYTRHHRQKYLKQNSRKCTQNSRKNRTKCTHP